MNAAVTGGTGFLGRVLVRMLVEQRAAVRVLFRQPKDEADLRALGAVPVPGDLTEPGGCDKLVEPGDVIFHIAARVDMTGPWEAFARTTIEGTRLLLQAALPRTPSRFVYASSASVYLGEGVTGSVCADRTPTNPLQDNFYARAKLEAEDLIRRECDKAGCPWTLVRLGFLYGPGNRALLNNFIPLAQRKLLYIIGDGENRIASLYVDDAARAMLLAGTHPAAERKIYDVASDERVTQRQYICETAKALDVAPPKRTVGLTTAVVGAKIASVLARLVGKEAPFNRPMVVLMAVDQELDSSRIRTELEWQPQVRFEEGMRLTRDWHRQHTR